MITALAAAAALLAAPDPRIELTDMLVTGVSIYPGDSGVLATYVTVTARAKDGAEATLYIPAMSRRQPLPPVSGLCRFTVFEGDLHHGWPKRARGLVVDRFACTIGSDSPDLPDRPPPKLL